MFVGEETLLPGAALPPGHILAHELGHTALDAFHPNRGVVEWSYEGRPHLPRPR